MAQLYPKHASGIGKACLAVILLGVTIPHAWPHCTTSVTSRHPRSHALAADLRNEAPFFAENATAMHKMMAGMEVKPTGDVNIDFATMMIPHHQGAIDMAVAYLRYGNNPQLRRLAQEIVVEQQQEIVAMRLALRQQLPPSKAAPTQVEPADFTRHDHSATAHDAMAKCLAASNQNN